MTRETNEHGGYAHKALVKEATSAKKCLVSLLESGSRDFDLIREFAEQYISYQSAADRISGQS